MVTLHIPLLLFRLTALLMGQIMLLGERHGSIISGVSSMNICWSGEAAI
jgi:hypothetical protein